MFHPIQRPLPHPGRSFALDYPKRVQADDQLGVAIEGVEMRSESLVVHHPDHDPVGFGKHWHIDVSLSDAPSHLTAENSSLLSL
jgi:hypothetical protein